jgi:NAD(P)-dependent dehydrogenase (short-subunit alcohol dehydrogenase family)
LQLTAIANFAWQARQRNDARHFLAAGARVAASDITKEGLQPLLKTHGALMPLQADAGDEDSIDMAFDAVRNHLGGLDVLLNNVCIAGPTAAADDVSLAAWNESLRVNVTSHFLFARRAIPLMKAQRRGFIVNISSGSAKVGLPLRLPYIVSKGAVLSLTMNLARELGPFGIRVNGILPGPIRAPRIERVIASKARALGMAPNEYEALMPRYMSMRTMVEPNDVAAVTEFLASQGGRLVSGQLIGVDGDLEWEE